MAKAWSRLALTLPFLILILIHTHTHDIRFYILRVSESEEDYAKSWKGEVCMYCIAHERLRYKLVKVGRCTCEGCLYIDTYWGYLAWCEYMVQYHHHHPDPDTRSVLDLCTFGVLYWIGWQHINIYPQKHCLFLSFSSTSSCSSVPSLLIPTFFLQQKDGLCRSWCISYPSTLHSI